MSTKRPHTITVSIGGAYPTGRRLLPSDWYAFRNATLRAVRETGAPVVFHGTGTGIYCHVSEPSFTVIATPAPNPTDAEHIYAPLRAELARLAGTYGQDSIALTLHAASRTEFIKPT